MKIISGGQTGVDRAALDAAMSLGAASAGWCPAGRLDETGKIPAHYPVRELAGAGSLERTEQNVRDADGTVIFYSQTLQGGTNATTEFCRAMGKPLLLLDGHLTSRTDSAKQIAEFVRAHSLETLNVAGPRASQWQNGYDYAKEALLLFLDQLAPAIPPRLSFIVPAYNEEHELPATLRAIRHAAEESQETHEIIVVDDASTDATVEIAQEFGAKTITVNHRQIAAVRNAGAFVARGEILFFVDADTHIVPDHVKLGMKALADGCAGGSARIAVDSHLPLWARLLLRSFCAIYFALGLGVGAFIFTRRRSFEAVGGFDEQYFAGEEVFLSLALKKLGPFKILREPIVTSARKLRMHSAGFVLTQSFFIAVGGKRSLRTRKRLALWYAGEREQGRPDEKVERVPLQV